MPVYNCGRFLEAALASVVAQSHRDWELVVVDDGSSDGSEVLLDRLASEDSRIRVFHQENQGLARALNRGLGECRGEWIARMDGDDIAYSNRLEAQLRWMRERPRLIATSSNARFIDPEGRPLGFVDPPESHEAIDQSLLGGNGAAIVHPTFFVRRKLIEDLGGYATDVELEDLDLFLRLTEKGLCLNDPTVLLDYRLHPRSTNHLRTERYRAITLETLEKARRRRGEPPPFSDPFEGKPVESDGGDLAALYFDWGCRAAQSGFWRSGLCYACKYVSAAPFRLSTWVKVKSMLGLAIASRKKRNI